MPGFTDRLWTQYSRHVTDYYLASFHRTRLEFDVGWMAVVSQGIKTITPLTAAESQEAQQFIDDLVRRKVFIANNSIAGHPAKPSPGATAANPLGADCPAYSAPWLARLQQRGVSFGLEGDWLGTPCMAPQRVGAILTKYRPVRFVFFGDAAALLSFHRQGLNDPNRFEVDFLTNVFVPWFKGSKDEIRRDQAMPRIRKFAGDFDGFVRQLLVER